MGSNNLELAGRFLSTIPTLRLEWSLEISESGIAARPFPLFWLGQRNKNDNPKAFAQLNALLSDLKVDPALLDIQERLSCHCITQGLSMPVSGPLEDFCLYFHYRDPDTKKESRVGYKSNGLQSIAKKSYLFSSFRSDPDGMVLSNMVHRMYRRLIFTLLKNNRLTGQSGYWLQERQNKIEEIYLTYPWHPRLDLILPDVCSLVSGMDLFGLSDYARLHFRHIGISTSDAPYHSLSIYFSGYCQNNWPLSFRGIQDEVRMSSDILAKAFG